MTCKDCGKEISDSGALRCHSCENKNRGISLPNTCKDCGKNIRSHNVRCKPCNSKNQRIPSRRCVDCNILITREATRCMSCGSIARTDRKHSEETRQKLSDAAVKQWDRVGRKIDGYTGEERKYYDYEIWRKAVLEHDNYECQHCGSKKKLKVHHMEDYANNPELRTEMSNGIILCKFCHDNFHHLFGLKSTRARVFWFFKNVKLGKGE